MRNAMTVDVEDYFQVAAFEKHISRDQWEQIPGRVERNTERILELFNENNVRATFFVLGWTGKRYPQLIRRIVNAGHELASHGFSHVRVTQQTPKEFQEDAIKAKKILEDISGEQVRGYRASSFSINANTLWALEILKKVGYAYSSSIYPIRHDLYGMPHAPRFTFSLGSGFLEIPVTTINICKINLPCGGGGYFRLYPYFLSRWGMRRVNKHEGQPCVFYFHPWEIDPEQPRIAGINMKTRFRHYINMRRMEVRILKLLHDFSWDRMDKIFLGVSSY